MKKYPVFVLSGLNVLLLVLYTATPKIAWTPRAWAGTFQWAPVTRGFSLPPFLQLLASWSGQFLIFGLWLVLAWWLGSRLMRAWFASEVMDGGEESILSLGLGLGCLSLLGFLLGAAHLYHRALIIPLGLAALFLVLRERPAMTCMIRDAGRTTYGLFTVQGDRHSWLFLFALCAVSFVFHLLGIFPPPVAFDEMNYQLALPKLYLLNHGFVNTPFNHLSFLPQNINMLFVLGLATGGFVTAKLFSLTLGIMAVFCIFTMGRRWIGEKGALLGAVIFLLTPVIGNQFRLAISDLGAGFYELTGTFLLLRWLVEPERPRLLTLSAIFWGLALGAKYTALPGYGLTALVLAGCLLLGNRRSWLLSGLLRYTVPALLLWSPWLIKNWWYTGNPVAPLLSTWIPSRNFIFAGEYQPRVDYVAGQGIPHYFPLHGLADLLLLPWSLATRYNDFNHDLGPVFLLCFLLLPLAWGRIRHIRKILLLLVVLEWILWLVTGVRMTRYFTAGLALTSLLGGAIVVRAMEREERWIRLVVFLPLLGALTLQTMRIIAYQNTFKKPWGYLAGRCSTFDYLDRTIRPDSPLKAYRFMNESLSADAKILVVQEFRTLYLDRKFLAATPWDNDYWHEHVRLSRDAAELRRRLKTSGVTHAFVNTYYLQDKTGSSFPVGWNDEDRKKSRLFLAECFEPLFFQDGLWVGRVKDEASAPGSDPIRRKEEAWAR